MATSDAALPEYCLVSSSKRLYIRLLRSILDAKRELSKHESVIPIPFSLLFSTATVFKPMKWLTAPVPSNSLQGLACLRGKTVFLKLKLGLGISKEYCRGERSKSNSVT